RSPPANATTCSNHSPGLNRVLAVFPDTRSFREVFKRFFFAPIALPQKILQQQTFYSTVPHHLLTSTLPRRGAAPLRPMSAKVTTLCPPVVSPATQNQ